MVSWLNEGCPDEGSGRWTKKGWWRLETNQTKIVYADDCDDVNLWWYCYAHAVDGSRSWGGNFSEWVPTRRFELCSSVVASDFRRIGMFEFPGGKSEDHHVDFG
jgi:uncharacterized membrane protein